jgi:hypothetical protein
VVRTVTWRQTKGARWKRLASVIGSPSSLPNGSAARESAIASMVSLNHPAIHGGGGNYTRVLAYVMVCPNCDYDTSKSDEVKKWQAERAKYPEPKLTEKK